MNRSYFTRLNLLNIRNKIWWRYLQDYSSMPLPSKNGLWIPLSFHYAGNSCASFYNNLPVFHPHSWLYLPAFTWRKLSNNIALVMALLSSRNISIKYFCKINFYEFFTSCKLIGLLIENAAKTFWAERWGSTFFKPNNNLDRNE